ncbi:MAPEG family protein [Marinicella litoralis]|uniref:MAPEG family protein n=1 Tax=Marinicella litoralis TaxID=644220 RepID=A0A4V3DI21_9GAMM|nr:MAPEG family protein [Marinicella litoralis]TDR20361.1 MAPEG family protein [Marinicella litoralis]
MEYAVIVLVLVLLQYSFISFMVGKARGTYNINAPAVSGDEMFERYYRVQQNTLEQLIVFVPGMLLFTHYVHALTAAGLGLVFFIGRMIYYKAYIADPKSRGLGFTLSFVAAHVLVIGGLVGAVLNLI